MYCSYLKLKNTEGLRVLSQTKSHILDVILEDFHILPSATLSIPDDSLKVSFKTFFVLVF